MTTQTGPDYILHCRELGFSDTEISAEMRRVGWQDSDIQAAYAQVSNHSRVGEKGGRMWLWIIIGVTTLVVLSAIGLFVYYSFFA